MDVAILFTVAGFVVTFLGALLRYDGHPGHDTMGLAGEGIGAADLVVVGVVDTQRAATAGVECSVFHRCEAMPDNLFELFGPYVIGALRGGLIAGAAVAAGWVVARLTKRAPG